MAVEIELEKTLALIKPDATRKGKAQEIMHLIEHRGFHIVAKQKLQLTPSRASEFYGEHVGKPFFPNLVNFMTSGPIWALVLAKPDAIKEWRAFMGPTNTEKARLENPRCLRALYGTDGTQNATHGSDSPASAVREIKFFFPGLILEPIMDRGASVAYIEARLQPALSKALTTLAREKPSAEKFEAITFLAHQLLANNPNKPKVVAPDEWEEIANDEEDDEADFEGAVLRAEPGQEPPPEDVPVARPPAPVEVTAEEVRPASAKALPPVPEPYDKPPVPELEEPGERENAAAVMVQAAYRGYHDRKVVEEMRMSAEMLSHAQELPPREPSTVSRVSDTNPSAEPRAASRSSSRNSNAAEDLPLSRGSRPTSARPGSGRSASGRSASRGMEGLAEDGLGTVGDEPPVRVSSRHSSARSRTGDLPPMGEQFPTSSSRTASGRYRSGSIRAPEEESIPPPEPAADVPYADEPELLDAGDEGAPAFTSGGIPPDEVVDPDALDPADAVPPPEETGEVVMDEPPPAMEEDAPREDPPLEDAPPPEEAAGDDEPAPDMVVEDAPPADEPELDVTADEPIPADDEPPPPPPFEDEPAPEPEDAPPPDEPPVEFADEDAPPADEPADEPAPAAEEEAPPPADEPPLDEPPLDEPPLDEPLLDEPPIEDAPVEDAPVDDAPVEEPPVDDAPVEEPPAEEEPPPADEPAMEEPPPADEPAMDEVPPADDPGMDEALIDEPPVDEPATMDQEPGSVEFAAEDDPPAEQPAALDDAGGDASAEADMGYDAGAGGDEAAIDFGAEEEADVDMGEGDGPPMDDPPTEATGEEVAMEDGGAIEYE